MQSGLGSRRLLDFTGPETAIGRKETFNCIRWSLYPRDWLPHPVETVLIDFMFPSYTIRYVQ